MTKENISGRIQSPYITTTSEVIDPALAHVVRFKSYPSCGVRLVGMATFEYLEELATNEILSIHQLYDGFTGRSGGAILAAANATGHFSAHDARISYLHTAHEEFGQGDTNITMFRNALHDLHNTMSPGEQSSDEQINGFISSYFHEVWPYIEPHLRKEIAKFLGDGWAGFALGPLKALGGYSTMRELQRIYVSHRSEVLDAFKSGLIEYFKVEGHAPTYDHSILQRALNKAFGNKLVSDTPKALFIAAYDYDGAQTVLMGGMNGSLWPEHTQESPLLFTQGNILTKEKTPVFQDVRIVDALMASTSIKGIIGDHVVPTTERTMGDLAEYSLSTLLNISAEVNIRANIYAQNTSRKSRFAFFQPNVTPVVVPRMMMMGSGYSTLTSKGRERDGVIRSISGFPTWSERAATSGIMAQLRWMYNTAAAQKYTGVDEALLHVDIPLENGHDGISDDIKDGRIENLAALTRFGTRQFQAHAAKIYSHIRLHAGVAFARGDISREVYRAACDALETNFASEDALAQMCEKAALSAEAIQGIIAPKADKDKVALPVKEPSGKKHSDKKHSGKVMPAKILPTQALLTKVANDAYETPQQGPRPQVVNMPEDGPMNSMDTGQATPQTRIIQKTKTYPVSAGNGAVSRVGQRGMGGFVGLLSSGLKIKF